MFVTWKLRLWKYFTARGNSRVKVGSEIEYKQLPCQPPESCLEFHFLLLFYYKKLITSLQFFSFYTYEVSVPTSSNLILERELVIVGTKLSSSIMDKRSINSLFDRFLESSGNKNSKETLLNGSMDWKYRDEHEESRKKLLLDESANLEL